MEWIQGKIYTSHEDIDTVCAMLLARGIKGLQIDDSLDMQNFLSENKQQWDYIDESLMNDTSQPSVTFYLPNNIHGNETLLNIKAGVSDLKTYLESAELELTDVDDETWLNNWKKFFKPLELGKRIVIKPVWEEYESTHDKVVFTINPGQVFGTGLHQTTQLCICALEEYVTPDCTVLDLGCGSGILSVIAQMLGAKSAFAVDLDPGAVPTAYENAALNNILPDNYEVICGDLLRDEKLCNKIRQNKYDLVLANIVADVIIALGDLAVDCLSDKGVFIASGIIEERIDDVVNAITGLGLEIISINSKDNWFCVISKKK